MGLRRQGILERGLSLGKYYLYTGDRGWLELVGGQGVWRLRKNVVGKIQDLGYNSVLIYISFMLFRVSFIVLFWFCFYCLWCN